MEAAKLIKDVWRLKWGRRVSIAVAIVLFFSIPVRCDGPYRGRVVEKTSGSPIPGVVVVVSWSAKSINVAGGTTRCIDAAEAVTDARGEFRIPGRSAALFGTIGTARIAIYKVGYQRVECMWKNIDRAGDCYNEPVALDGKLALFPLSRVARGRLRSEEGRDPSSVCGRKDGKPLSALEEERREYLRIVGADKMQKR
jgi:hypothetical protein